MPSSRDPVALTTEERTRELAHLLAQGLLRLRRPFVAPIPATPSAGQKVSNKSRNELASSPEQSVTVHVG